MTPPAPGLAKAVSPRPEAKRSSAAVERPASLVQPSGIARHTSPPDDLPFQRLPQRDLPVDLWSCRIDDLPADLLEDPLYRRILSPEEQHRLRAFRFDRDRLRFLAGRLLVRVTLSRYTGLPPQQLEFTHNAFGRPELAPGTPALRFNLSRAGSLVVLAASPTGEIGVDVEDEHRVRAADELAPGILAERELATFLAAPPSARNALFLRYWTLKEAFVKARGMGLSLDVRRVHFTPPGHDPIRLHHDPGIVDDPASWRFELTRIDDRYPLAVAFRPAPSLRSTPRATLRAMTSGSPKGRGFSRAPNL